MAAFFMILFNRKFISFLFALNLFQSAVFAQDNSILVHGSGVESVSQSPMEYATIILAEPGSESPVTGTTTGADGTFKLESSLNDFTTNLFPNVHTSYKFTEGISLQANQLDYFIIFTAG